MGILGLVKSKPQDAQGQTSWRCLPVRRGLPAVHTRLSPVDDRFMTISDAKKGAFGASAPQQNF